MKQLFFLVVAACLLASCVSYERASSPAHGTDRGSLYAGAPLEPAAVPAIPDRKMVYAASMELTVTNRDSIRDEITALATRFDGYLLQSNSQTITIRLLSDDLDAAMAAVSGMGKVESSNVVGEDVTDQYEDLNIRLENAQKARSRYLALLEKAANVAEALQVERELERLNAEIDQLQGKINRLDHLEAYSTLTVHLRERTKPGVIGYVGIGLFHSVKWLFVRS